MEMKKIMFCGKLILLVVIILNGVSFSKLSSKEDLFCLEDSLESYVMVEKNIIDKSFVSILYKNEDNDYLSKIYDYDSNEEININDLIKKEKINDYNLKIEELLYLKYPKFIVEEFLKDDTKKSYILRDRELVIYFNNVNLDYEIDEIFYLKVNYNEIKDYLEFTVILDNDYENESGYDYTNSKKMIALTFDDSPNKGKTNKILSLLNDFHFHATFFVVGEKCEYNEDLLISIKNSGNEIGSHTYKHQNLNKLSDEEFIDDYYKVNEIYKRLFKEDLKLLRPPYGIYKNSQLGLLDVSFIMWSLDTNDWRYKNSDYLVDYVISNVKDGDIILFHDSYESTVLAIEKLLPLLYSKGYQVVSVSELASLKGIDLEDNQVYHKFN